MKTSSIQIALVGHPNSGKTTLFNTLTGSRQKTGNYPGVTVERKEGFIPAFGFTLFDLPGLYSLNTQSPDEEISVAVLSGKSGFEHSPDVILAVADATALSRQLYLVSELRELKVPMVLALTMNDLLARDSLVIDVKDLEKKLGMPVVLVSSFKKTGISELLNQLKSVALAAQRKIKPQPDLIPHVQEFIEARYHFIENLIKTCVRQSTPRESITHKIDRVLLHPILGPFFLFILFALFFQLLFSGAEIPMNFIETQIGHLGNFVSSTLPEGTFQDLVSNGIIAGVGAVVVFLPQILLLFAFFTLLEDSGYMARAAFILDRLMSGFGLTGRSFFPLLSSFACAIPGIMATRTLPSRRDRMITILIAPLMACSARIPIYTMIVATFIPTVTIAKIFNLPGLVLFGLYALGLGIAGFVAFVLSKTILKGEGSAFVIELPTYKIPSLKNLFLTLYDRAVIFLKRAGTIILSVSILLWFLANYPKMPKTDGDTKVQASQQLENSYMGRAGKAIEPFVEPLGFDWKIGIGLISSFAAREVLISTLATVYAAESQDDSTVALGEKLKAAVNPKTQQNVFNLPTVFSLLVFYVLACQCVSTLAITKRETNSWTWPAFMFGYMTILAYIASFFTYRIASFFLH